MTISIEEIKEKVVEVLAEKSCLDEKLIHLDSSLADDLGMDSLDAVEAAFNFEEEYGLEISDDDIRKFGKVQDIITYISDKLNTN